MNNKETLILVQAPQAYQPHRWVPVAVSILAFAAFLAFILPNAKASEDLGMVQVFEPDEAALFPTIAAMASPKSDSLTFIKQFIHCFWSEPMRYMSEIMIFLLRQWEKY